MTFTDVNLENFEDGASSPPNESAEFKRGYQAGILATQHSDAAQLTQTIENISATLSDMAFGYAEARILLLDRIRQLLTQVAGTVLPQIAQKSFAAHLVDVISADFDIALSEAIQISVNPVALEMLSDAFAGDKGNFNFVADPVLMDGQAILKNSEIHIMIDLPALTLVLQTALNGLEPLERIQSNG